MSQLETHTITTGHAHGLLDMAELCHLPACSELASNYMANDKRHQAYKELLGCCISGEDVYLDQVGLPSLKQNTVRWLPRHSVSHFPPSSSSSKFPTSSANSTSTTQWRPRSDLGGELASSIGSGHHQLHRRCLS